jgi:hypothetical protein
VERCIIFCNVKCGTAIDDTNSEENLIFPLDKWKQIKNTVSEEMFLRHWAIRGKPATDSMRCVDNKLCVAFNST